MLEGGVDAVTLVAALGALSRASFPCPQSRREQRFAYLSAQLDGLRRECGQLATLTGTPFKPQVSIFIERYIDR